MEKINHKISFRQCQKSKDCGYLLPTQNKKSMNIKTKPVNLQNITWCLNPGILQVNLKREQKSVKPQMFIRYLH